MPADERRRRLDRQPDADPHRQALEACRRGAHTWTWGSGRGVRCSVCASQTTQAELCQTGDHAWGPWREGAAPGTFARACCACDQPEELTDAPCLACRQAGHGSPASRCTRCDTASSRYGLVISGLGLQAKREAAIRLLTLLRGLPEPAARDLCRSPVVPIFARVSAAAAHAAERRFAAAQINTRVTERTRPR